MGTVRQSLALGALCALLAAPAFATFVPYAQVRQDHPIITDAVGSLPTSDIHSDFNQISALLQRSSIEALAQGGANTADLPPNFETSLRSALADLQQDFKDGVGSLTLDESYVLLQVVDVVAVRRPYQLYQSWPGEGCIPTEEQPNCPLAPAVISQLNALTGALRSDINALIAWYNDNNGTDPDHALYSSGSVKASTFGSVMDDVRATYGYIRGVESIDD